MQSVEDGLTLLRSVATGEELRQVMRRPSIAEKISAEFVSRLEHILAQAELVAVRTQIIACRDKKDNKFLELAVDGKADVIITGDRDLLVLNPYVGVRILTPTAFMAERASTGDSLS